MDVGLKFLNEICGFDLLFPSSTLPWVLNSEVFPTKIRGNSYNAVAGYLIVTIISADKILAIL